ncbi:MAG: D-alanyl-D-alanine carboxypeptidase/D-alanyl-D-alanine-endopeptidase [Thermoleophilia bacterium]|nr:D-alanyl-D-alanine carboxypeptidase/D-alanyl-D-alanine-endopeptidase [Thermoleophilia bacterium]
MTTFAAHRSPARAALVTLAAIIGLLVAACSSAAGATLDQRIRAAVQSSGVASTTSVHVWEQGANEELTSISADRSVAPASNMKLFTSAAALQHFGPDYTFTTSVALRGKLLPDQHTWKGTVYLIGGGDPMLSTLGFSRDNYRGVGTNLGALVAQIKALGITRIDGRVIVVDDFLDRQRFVAEWPGRFRFDEAGALGALTVNQSRIGRWLSSTSTFTPDLQAGATLRMLLERADVEVTGAVARGVLPADAAVAGTVQSQPLSRILGYMMRASDNFTAELLLKDLGRDVYGPGAGSTSSGRRAGVEQLRALGVGIDGIRWVDGSGLSVYDRVTARTIAQLLQNGADSTWGEPWIASFPVSGTSGTIRKRMTKWPYRGRVHAKTGTINQASALSGFADRLGAPTRYGFSVVTYGGPGSSVSYRRARALQDRIAMILVR